MAPDSDPKNVDQMRIRIRNPAEKHLPVGVVYFIIWSILLVQLHVKSASRLLWSSLLQVTKFSSWWLYSMHYRSLLLQKPTGFQGHCKHCVLCNVHAELWQLNVNSARTFYIVEWRSRLCLQRKILFPIDNSPEFFTRSLH